MLRILAQFYFKKLPQFMYQINNYLTKSKLLFRNISIKIHFQERMLIPYYSTYKNKHNITFDFISNRFLRCVCFIDSLNLNILTNLMCMPLPFEYNHSFTKNEYFYLYQPKHILRLLCLQLSMIKFILFDTNLHSLQGNQVE